MRERWWWLSFVDDERPVGQRCLGVTVVEGRDFQSAVERASALGINPGGEVAGVELPPPLSEQYRHYRGRLVSREEANAGGHYSRRDRVQKEMTDG